MAKRWSSSCSISDSGMLQTKTSRHFRHYIHGIAQRPVRVRDASRTRTRRVSYAYGTLPVRSPVRCWHRLDRLLAVSSFKRQFPVTTTTTTTRNEGWFPLFANNNNLITNVHCCCCCQEQQETETNTLARTKATPPQTVVLIVVSHGLGRSMIVCRISMIVVEVGSIHIQHRLPAAETPNIRRRWPLPPSRTTSGQIQLGTRPCRHRHY